MVLLVYVEMIVQSMMVEIEMMQSQLKVEMVEWKWLMLAKEILLGLEMLLYLGLASRLPFS